jgi:hypothetical protein
MTYPPNFWEATHTRAERDVRRAGLSGQQGFPDKIGPDIGGIKANVTIHELREVTTPTMLVINRPHVACGACRRVTWYFTRP